MAFIKNIFTKKKGKETEKKTQGPKPVEKKKEVQKPAQEAEYSSLRKKGEERTVSPKKQSPKKKKNITGEAYSILIRPIITEKATELVSQNKYVFEVSHKSNKINIKKAVQDVYDVEPVDIKIINMRGKRVRYGRIQGKTKHWKKAIVTLKPGDKIEIYEGV